MKRKKGIKKPPSGQTEGGLENELGCVVFYPNNNINPAYCKIDYAKQADTFRQQANYFVILAQIAEHMSKVTDLQEQANLTLMPIYAGGTVYQLPGGNYED